MRRLLPLLAALLLTPSLLGFGNAASAEPADTLQPEVHLASEVPPPFDPFLDDLQERTFRWFWDTAHPQTGLTPDRWPSPSVSSVAAVGFGLSAYVVGAENGWVSRADAAARTRQVLQFLYDAPQNDGPNATGYRGFYYHFLDMETGRRAGAAVELSTIDTALLVAGALSAAMYFDGNATDEWYVRDLATQIYRRVEWTWAQPRPPLISLGWRPELPGDGFLPFDYGGYNETMLLYVLALGSPTYPIDASAWDAYTEGYQWRSYYGRQHVAFGPLFGHQYSHTWIDFRNIKDAYMRGRGIDYFQNSRRATLSQRDYARANPGGFKGYGSRIWGLTASDGPANITLPVNGRDVRFHSYVARAASATETLDDGTIAPTAAGGSIALTPGVSILALKAMYNRYGDELWGQYGFYDSFNPTFDFPNVRLDHGRVVPGRGWFDTDYLGIDQGPIVLMIENYRSGLLWDLMRRQGDMRRGLERAGFSGGWLGSNVAGSEPGGTAAKVGVPADLSLAVRPNPSAGAAEVRFELPAPSAARVTVSDALGREVAVLLDRQLGAGSHAVRWPGDVPAGVYVVHVDTGDRIVTRRVTRLPR